MRRSNLSKYFERLLRSARNDKRLSSYVESAIDANNLLLHQIGLPPAASARESFQQLRDHKLLKAETANRYIEKYVGLRNVIVHLYERVDAKTLYYSAKRLLKDSEAYARQIHIYLARRQK